jgi:5-methylcytosine-specific restriction endonuclease McrA
MSARRALVLGIVATDATFEKAVVRGDSCWVGRCLHCNAKIVVDESGETLGTIEHILPQNHGGTDDLANLALACARCNSQKGVRHDARSKNDPKLVALVASLGEKRRARTRAPIFELPRPKFPAR